MVFVRFLDPVGMDEATLADYVEQLASSLDWATEEDNNQGETLHVQKGQEGGWDTPMC